MKFMLWKFCANDFRKSNYCICEPNSSNKAEFKVIHIEIFSRYKLFLLRVEIGAKLIRL